MQHDQQVVSADASQLTADGSQAMVVQQQLGAVTTAALTALQRPALGRQWQPGLRLRRLHLVRGHAAQGHLGGNADQWWANAAAAGHLEGQVPEVGSIVVWGPDVPGESYGPGADVEAVQGNEFEVSEMAFDIPGGGWGRVDYRWVPAGAGYLGFIYGPIS